MEIDTERTEIISGTETDSTHGTEPSMRSVDELLRMGAVILDKPRGPTSHQIVSWVKEILGLEKAGHHGTLDPNTTGVLPVALGSSVRLLDSTLSEGKEYITIMKLHKDVDVKVVKRILSEFTGEIYQMVPVRSAVKRGLRTRKIEYLKLLESHGREHLLLVGCESGTYIRTLLHDMGEVLGVGANMGELRRTRSGGISEKEAVTLQYLKDAWVIYNESGDDIMLRKAVVPAERLVASIPKLYLKDTAVDAICHGAPLGIPGLAAVDRSVMEGDQVSLMTLKGEIIGLGTAAAGAPSMIKMDKGKAAAVNRVIMEPGTYPRAWKKSGG